MWFQNSIGSFDDDDHFFLECNANLYLPFHHVVVVHITIEQQYEQFTQVETIFGVLQRGFMRRVRK